MLLLVDELFEVFEVLALLLRLVLLVLPFDTLLESNWLLLNPLRQKLEDLCVMEDDVVATDWILSGLDDINWC